MYSYFNVSFIVTLVIAKGWHGICISVQVLKLRESLISWQCLKRQRRQQWKEVNRNVCYACLLK